MVQIVERCLQFLKLSKSLFLFLSPSDDLPKIKTYDKRETMNPGATTNSTSTPGTPGTSGNTANTSSTPHGLQASQGSAFSPYRVRNFLLFRNQLISNSSSSLAHLLAINSADQPSTRQRPDAAGDRRAAHSRGPRAGRPGRALSRSCQSR